MKKYFKAENEAEARIIVGIYAAQYGLEVWDAYYDHIEYPTFIGHAGEMNFPEESDEEDWKIFGHTFGGGIRELFALARNGFIEVLWKPEMSEGYYVPVVESVCSVYHPATWRNDKTDRARLDRGLVCRTKEEAASKRDMMLAAIAGEEEIE